MTKPTKWLCAQRRLRSAWASAQSDQSLRCPHEESLDPQLPIKRTANNLIRLGECSGWSESSLGALILFVLSYRGSLMITDYERRFKEKLTCPHLSRLMTKPTNWHWPSDDSDQPGHRPTSSLIDVFAVRSEGSLVPKISSCGQRRLWSDWAHRAFCWFCRDAAHFDKSSDTYQSSNYLIKWEAVNSCLKKLCVNTSKVYQNSEGSAVAQW